MTENIRPIPGPKPQPHPPQNPPPTPAEKPIRRHDWDDPEEDFDKYLRRLKDGECISKGVE